MMITSTQSSWWTHHKTIAIYLLCSLTSVHFCNADTFYVINTEDSGSGSLRKAITDMNTLGVSPSEIEFNISGSKLIELDSALPPIEVSCHVNSTNVAGIVLDGSSVSSGPGLRFIEQTVQISNVEGLEIRDFPAAGIVIAPTANEQVNVVTCYIHSNGSHGVMVNGGRLHAITDGCVIENNALDGVCVTNAATSVDVEISAIQFNGLSGVRLIGSDHIVDGSFVIANGDSEGSGGDNGGVVFGGTGNATQCSVDSCTLAANEPYGAKIVSGPGNEVRGNETYLNVTKGIENQAAGELLPPDLSYFVVNDVDDEIIMRVSDSGTANDDRVWEIFVAFPGSDEGAVFADEVETELNSSGEATELVSFDRNVTFFAAAISESPINFDIDHEDRITATSTDPTGNNNTSEFAVPALPTLPGDFNLDGSVGAADYVIWQNNEGEPNPVYTQGDADFDGDVDEDDYDIWVDNYGLTP